MDDGIRLTADGDLSRAGRTLTAMRSGTESRWRLSSPGNRVMWAVVAAFVVWLASRSGALALVTGGIVFGVLTAISAGRRR